MFYAFERGNRCKCELKYKTRTPYSEIKECLQKECYKLLTTEDEYYKIENISGFKIKIKCSKDHISEINFYNFKKGAPLPPMLFRI